MKGTLVCIAFLYSVKRLSSSTAVACLHMYMRWFLLNSTFACHYPSLHYEIANRLYNELLLLLSALIV